MMATILFKKDKNMNRIDRINTMNFSADYSNFDINAIVDGVSSVGGLFKKTDAQKDLKARCGKKPLVALGKKGKAKKRKFEECREKLNNPIVQQQPIVQQLPTKSTIVPIQPKVKSNKNLYIGIGIGAIVIATLVIFRKKIF